MTKEFKKITNGNETRYVIESMTAGATGAGAVATAPGRLGKLQKRLEELKDKVSQKPRQGPLRPQTGAGVHKNKKRNDKHGDVKHKGQSVHQENFNGEYDDEAGMAESNLHTLARAVKGLMDTIDSDDNLPEWCQEKIAKAEMMLSSVRDYLQSQKEQGIDPEQDMAEGKLGNAAALAGAIALGGTLGYQAIKNPDARIFKTKYEKQSSDMNAIKNAIQDRIKGKEEKKESVEEGSEEKTASQMSFDNSSEDWKTGYKDYPNYKLHSSLEKTARGKKYRQGWEEAFRASKRIEALKKQDMAEGSEWETRHDEFVTVGDRTTPEQINKIVKALIGAAKQADGKRGFLNQIVGKQSNGDLARMAHAAETLAKNIQRNSNAKPGTDERKELGQHLVYAVGLLKRMSGEQDMAEGYDDDEEFIPQIYARIIPGTKSFLITKVLDANLGLKVGDKVSYIALTSGKFKGIPKSLSYKQDVAEGADIEYIVVIRDEQRAKSTIRISALTPTDAKEKAEAQGYEVIAVKDPQETDSFKMDRSQEAFEEFASFFDVSRGNGNPGAKQAVELMKAYDEDWKPIAQRIVAYAEDNPDEVGYDVSNAIHELKTELQQGVAEGERTMSRAAKGNEKYGKDGMKALAKAGRDGASEKKLDAIRDKHDNYNEEWSKKYKSSISCSHPKGFSQKAHCASKNKHNESMMTMEMVCQDCGMCRTHGNVKEGLRDPRDNPCWKGYKPVGTKKKGGRTVPNCVPKEGVVKEDTYTKNLQLQLQEKFTILKKK